MAIGDYLVFSIGLSSQNRAINATQWLASPEMNPCTLVMSIPFDLPASANYFPFDETHALAMQCRRLSMGPFLANVQFAPGPDDVPRFASLFAPEYLTRGTQQLLELLQERVREPGYLFTNPEHALLAVQMFDPYRAELLAALPALLESVLPHACLHPIITDYL